VLIALLGVLSLFVFYLLYLKASGASEAPAHIARHLQTIHMPLVLRSRAYGITTNFLDSNLDLVDLSIMGLISDFMHLFVSQRYRWAAIV
jgi:hypothetical protein